MSATYRRPADGAQITVPDAFIAVYDSRKGWERVGDPRPLIEWTVAQLRDYAKAHDISLKGAKTKEEIVQTLNEPEGPRQSATTVVIVTQDDDKAPVSDAPAP